MNDNRKIIHIDMDAFFASVEQLDNPDLRKKPVIVGGNPRRRGVVAACSYEARHYGIHSAMPCAKAVKLCPQAFFLRPNMNRYKEISRKIITIFHDYTDLVEPLSLDEAFLDVTKNKKNIISATWLAEMIRQHVYQETGLTASAGVSYNKFLAKVASDLNKPNGISVITPKQAQPFIAKLPIGKFFGVGKVTEKKMFQLGVHTGGDLLKYKKSILINHLGKAGSCFYDIARGIDNRQVQNNRKRKSLGAETTLQYDTSCIDKIKAILNQLAAKVEKSLLIKKHGGSTVTLKVRYSDFTTVTRSITLRCPIYRKTDILHQTTRLLQTTDAGIIKIRLLGITISKLTDNEKPAPRQLNLPFTSLNSHPNEAQAILRR